MGRDGTIFVEDRLSRDRREFDEQLQAQLQSVIRRFDSDGEYTGLIGQEGLNGTPFPYIRNIVTNERGDLVVVSRAATMWVIYWYDAEANHRYTIQLDENVLPATSRDSYTSISRIVPATAGDTLYVKADYYGRKNEADGEGDVGFLRSSLMVLDPASGQIGTMFDLPKVYYGTDRTRRTDTSGSETTYELLGTASGGYFFCLGAIRENTYRLLIIERSGRVVHRDEILLDDAEILYRTFYVTPGGDLTGLIGDKLSVRLYIWRTSRYVEAEDDQDR